MLNTEIFNFDKNNNNESQQFFILLFIQIYLEKFLPFGYLESKK